MISKTTLFFILVLVRITHPVPLRNRELLTLPQSMQITKDVRP